jgi:hypothetical protein
VGVIGGNVGYWILKKVCPGGNSGYLSGQAYANKSKLGVLFGERFFDEIPRPHGHRLRMRHRR